MRRSLRPLRAAAVIALFAATGCDTLRDNLLGGTPEVAVGTPGYVAGFLGGVVADEPRAALVGRDILSAGGDAADAAVAVAFAMAVTLPSRAGLGGGGVCVVYDPSRRGPNNGVPEVVLFTPPVTKTAGDRPAGVPLLARGLFALHSRYGKLPFEQIITRAEQLARFGTPISRAFARDVAVVAAPLAADPGNRPFFGADGQPLAEGATLQQPDLAVTLAALRTQGVGDLYQGGLARRVAAASPDLGAGLTAEALRAGLPRFVPALDEDLGRDVLAVPPTDAGVATIGAVRVLRDNPEAADAAQGRAAALALAVRAGQPGATLLATADLAPGALPALPASAGLVTLDSGGRSVACALSMGNLFGTGRVVPGTGILLGASPAAMPPALLAPAMVYNTNLHAFRAAAVGTGQGAAAVAAAFAILGTLSDAATTTNAGVLPTPPPDPGRADAIACARYLPEAERSCGWAADPRGAGLAVGSN